MAMRFEDGGNMALNTVLIRNAVETITQMWPHTMPAVVCACHANTHAVMLKSTREKTKGDFIIEFLQWGNGAPGCLHYLSQESVSGKHPYKKT